MAGSTSLHEELGALHAELRKAPQTKARQRRDSPGAPLEAKAGEPALSEAMVELEDQLSELGKVLSGYTGSVEDLVAEHPLVSVLAAFALGIAVGRLMGKA